MHPAESYFKSMHEIHATGGAMPETSYYGALENLMNEIGHKEKPRVRCVIQLANRGAGHPDGGLYSQNQFQSFKDGEIPLGQDPERGVIEIKAPGEETFVTAEGSQVSRYFGKYRQVLVTNYRDFVFLGQDKNGVSYKGECLRLAASETAFWAKCAQPRKFAEEVGERLVEYLRRMILQSANLESPEELAWFLASYAKEAKARIEERGDIPGLLVLRESLETALGMKFGGEGLKEKEKEKGEHFFRATLVQTLFYGVFSSWVLWARQGGKGRFNWHEASWNLHVPIIAGLFDQIATRNKLQPLGLDEVLDWTGMVLHRVVQEKFFAKFEEEHAVQYFYEPFLKAYDPELRKDLGVWYTPLEIVKYQVERVDMVLREELGIADGLADESVYVLDPCCGTGAYIVEVLRKIHDTLKENGGDALMAQRLKQAAVGRVFGFELLPAPFVVSHMQIGLLLRTLGAPLSNDKDERVGVYLTNALTGWEPPKKPKAELPFPELQQEKDAAEKVKRDKPILVILGNPPYNAFAGTSPEEEQGLVEPYKEGLNKPVKDGGWGIKKFNLDDLYVRFFRIAERRMIKGGRGIVSFISNFSYLGDPSFVVMREHFLSEFDKLWFDCMNGDSRETGKVTPDGKPDPSAFSTEQNREGIRVGTAICVMARVPAQRHASYSDGVEQPPSAVPVKAKALAMSAQAGAPVPQEKPLALCNMAGVKPKAKPAKAEYVRNLPHLQLDGRTLFVTFCSKKRWIIPESLREQVLRHCLHDHGRKIHVHGVVVMPDHVHMVFTPLCDDEGGVYGLAEIMNGIKGASAHAINKLLGRKGSVWQDESFDHVLRRDESAREKVEYICLNPVRKGLVEDENDYSWLWREYIEGQNDVEQPPPAVLTKAQCPGMSAQAGAPVPRAKVLFRHFWGTNKRGELLDSLTAKKFDKQYEVAKPARENRYSFRPADVTKDYMSWTSIHELSEKRPFNGPIERRGNSLIVFPEEKKHLCDNLRKYLDPDISDQEIGSVQPRFMLSSGEFDADKTRGMLKGKAKFSMENLKHYPFKPFDVRLAYLDASIAPLFSRPAPDLLLQSKIPHNSYFITRDTADKFPEGVPFFISNLICDYDSISGHARHFPFLLCKEIKKKDKHTGDIFADQQECGTAAPGCSGTGEGACATTTTANLSPKARAYLAAIGIKNPDKDIETAGLIWMHALAIGYSPAYLDENADGIRQDWPRIPLPATKDALLASAALGREVAALLDTEKPVPGVTSGKIRQELKTLGVVSKRGGGSLDPGAGELDVTAGWGHAGKEGVTMPGRGTSEERNYQNEERAAIESGLASLGLDPAQSAALLGDKTLDIFLNGVAYWKNIPANVWSYTIGGYQVIKKWLSYREKTLLGRGLTLDEAQYVTETVRRLAALLLLAPRLDENYKAIKEKSWD
jgi:REP element-mobilizing transposase RayT